MECDEYVGLHIDQLVVKLSLSRRKLNYSRLRLPHRKGANIATSRAIDDPREGVQVLNVGNEPDSVIGWNHVCLRQAPDTYKIRVVTEDRLSPGRCRGLIERAGHSRRPLGDLSSHFTSGSVDKRIGGRHIPKGLVIPNQIRTQHVQQDEQVMVVKLNWSCGQKHGSLRVVTEESNRLMSIGIRVPDVVSFVDDHEVELWRWLQVQ